jgi:ABC-type amino acid transport substrate-binding protein
MGACAPVNPATPKAGSTPGSAKIRIGVSVDLPPFSQPDGSGGPSGFEADLVKTIALRDGLDVELVVSEYGQLLTFVNNCQLDGAIAAITITDELKQVMSFSDPYYSTGQVVVVKDGNIQIGRKEDLPGMQVGTELDTPSEAALKQISGVKILGYNSFYLASQDLVNGYIDAMVTDRPRALSYANIKRNHLKVVGAEFGRADYGIAFCSRRDDLRTKFNAGLSSIRESGLLDRLIKKWAIEASLAP